MQANEILTVGTFSEWAQALLARLPLPAAPPAAAAAAEVVLYSKQRLAEVLDVHIDTVGAWLRKGKKGKNGQPVKLQAYYFTSEPRIPWPAVLAYHRGEAFDLDALPAPVLPAPVGPPLARPDPLPPPAAPHLRVA